MVSHTHPRVEPSTMCIIWLTMPQAIMSHVQLRIDAVLVQFSSSVNSGYHGQGLQLRWLWMPPRNSIHVRWRSFVSVSTFESQRFVLKPTGRTAVASATVRFWRRCWRSMNVNFQSTHTKIFNKLFGFVVKERIHQASGEDIHQKYSFSENPLVFQDQWAATPSCPHICWQIQRWPKAFVSENSWPKERPLAEPFTRQIMTVHCDGRYWDVPDRWGLCIHRDLGSWYGEPSKAKDIG